MVGASRSALAAYSIAAAGKATTSEIHSAMAPKRVVEDFTLKNLREVVSLDMRCLLKEVKKK